MRVTCHTTPGCQEKRNSMGYGWDKWRFNGILMDIYGIYELHRIRMFLFFFPGRGFAPPHCSRLRAFGLPGEHGFGMLWDSIISNQINASWSTTTQTLDFIHESSVWLCLKMGHVHKHEVYCNWENCVKGLDFGALYFQAKLHGVGPNAFWSICSMLAQQKSFQMCFFKNQKSFQNQSTKL